MDCNLKFYSAILGGLIVLWRLRVGAQNRQANPNGLPLPPGPKAYPLIGNLLDFPITKPWLAYDKLMKLYGGLIYLNVFGQPFLIVGNREIAYDLFEKRSSNYSDRPHLPMLMDLMHWDNILALMPYGDRWRTHRRAFHSQFHPNVVQQYQPIQVGTTRVFLRWLLDTPEQFRDHIHLMFASTIIKISYGIDVKGKDDPYMHLIEEALAGLSEAGNPGAFLVDFIPAMKHIPSWFPGAAWKRKAEHWADINERVSREPIEQVKKELGAGNAVPSVATRLIEEESEKGKAKPKYDTIPDSTCLSAFVGGAETTLSIIQSFFLAMSLHPQYQKKAQAELDSVLRGRLPEFSDRPNLPYVNALVKESLRWNPVAPNAIVHTCTEGDEYNGYYIPKGTYVIGNSWSMLHDSEQYKEPLNYNPERFLKDGKTNPSIRDPAVAAFGYGRRICPGRFFAENSLFIAIAHVVSVFEIRPAVDANGKDILVVPEMSSGLISAPLPFQCRITPRSTSAIELIKNTEFMD